MEDESRTEQESVREGVRVAYVPGHAGGDLAHPDVEFGTVSSRSSKYVFVKFDKNVSVLGLSEATAQACGLDDLVLINSSFPTLDTQATREE